MANIQLENGYTRIANGILEQLVKADLLGAEFRVIYFLLRKTYGYGKKSDKISLTQFEKGTGLSRPTIVKTLKNLMSRKMIIKLSLEDEGVVYTFEKDHEKWVVNTHLLVKSKGLYSKDALTKTSKDALTHKRKKENTKETTEHSSEEIGLLIKSFEEINPNAKNFYARPPQRKACDELITLYGFERVKSVIEKTLPKTNQMEYMPTIISPTQLLEKWSSLEANILKLKGKQKPTSKIAFQ